MTLDIGALYEAHQAELLGFVRSQGLPLADAEDLCADVWLRAQQALAHDGNVRAWLFQTARWRIIDRARRDRHEADLDDVREPTAAAEKGPGLPLDQLTARQRQALTLRLAGYTGSEIADRIGTTEGAVKGLLHRARLTIAAVVRGERAPKAPRTELCAVAGCARPNVARGLCNIHRKRQRRGIPLDVPIRERRPKIPVCTVPGCDKPTKARGRCKNHYAQWHWRKQRAGLTLPPRPPCATPGCDQLASPRTPHCLRCRGREWNRRWRARQAATLQSKEG